MNNSQKKERLKANCAVADFNLLFPNFFVNVSNCLFCCKKEEIKIEKEVGILFLFDEKEDNK